MKQVFATLTLVLIGLVLLCGCTHDTQRVQLMPKAPQTGPDYGNGLDVALEVTDRRADTALGVLETGDDTPPATIITDQDLTYIIKLACAEALQGFGFRPAIWDDKADHRLVIEIKNIERRIGSGIPHTVHTEVVLTARAWAADRTYKGKAVTTTDDTLAFAPSTTDNAEALDQAITQTLHKLFNTQLATFLAQH